jgi:hypothetical protein
LTLFKFLVDLQFYQCEIGGVFEHCSCGLHSCLDILNPNHHINKFSGPFILITIGKVFQIENIESTLEKKSNLWSISSNNVFPSLEEELQSLLEESWFELEDDILFARMKLKRRILWCGKVKMGRRRIWCARGKCKEGNLDVLK